MKILVMSFRDSGGGVGKLVRAISEHPRHQAQGCRWEKGSLKYSTSASTIWQPGKKRTLELMNWAHAVVVIGPWWKNPRKLPWGSACVFPPGAPRRPVVVNYRGSPYRGMRNRYDQRDIRAGVIQTGNFLDLTLVGRRKDWLPVPIWADELRKYRNRQDDGFFHVAQAVTVPKRFPLKKTPAVKRQVKSLDGIKLDIITKVTNKACLARLGRADVVITAFKDGFGNAGLEAMGMGIPIVANAYPKLLKRYKGVIGYWPFARTEVENLGELIVRMRDDPVFYNDVRQKGVSYLQRFHSPRAVAEKAVALCQAAKPIKY